MLAMEDHTRMVGKEPIYIYIQESDKSPLQTLVVVHTIVSALGKIWSSDPRWTIHTHSWVETVQCPQRSLESVHGVSIREW